MLRPQRTSNRIAALFLDASAAETRRTLSALRFSKHETRWAAALVERWHALAEEMTVALLAGSPPEAKVRRWLARIGRLYAGAFLRVALARWTALRAAGRATPDGAAVRSLHRAMRRSLFRDAIELADLQVTGDDLRHAGIPAGPIYAKILHALLEQVLEDPARNTPDALLAAVKTATRTTRINTLINTHWHPEQVGANEAVGKSGGVIFAHEKTKTAFQRSLDKQMRVVAETMLDVPGQGFEDRVVLVEEGERDRPRAQTRAGGSHVRVSQEV